MLALLLEFAFSALTKKCLCVLSEKPSTQM